jgi:hypothetical protein
MFAYQLAVLSAYPQAEVAAILAFLDAGPRFDPFVVRPVLKRKDLEAGRKAWEAKIALMMNDTIFAPKPGIYCRWCSFSKDKKGPCPY